MRAFQQGSLTPGAFVRSQSASANAQSGRLFRQKMEGVNRCRPYFCSTSCVAVVCLLSAACGKAAAHTRLHSVLLMVFAVLERDAYALSGRIRACDVVQTRSLGCGP